MPTTTDIKTNFTAGEISRDLLGRGDLRAYENGALTLRNVFIQPTGGVTRRAGLRHIDTADGDGRLVPFEFSTEQSYLLSITDGKITIYGSGAPIATLGAPWNADQITQIAWTQSADTLLLVHPEVSPRRLVRGASGVFSLLEWEFFTENNISHPPFYKFVDTNVTLTPGGTSGSVSLTASAPVFSEDHEGVRLRIGGKQVIITDYDSPTVVTADVIETLSGTSATIDWDEAAFSPVRGYPSTVAFHQDRLVIGGSRDLPHKMWFSHTGDLFNFDLGEGLDDEAIEFALLSDQINAIRGVFSGRHLQVFTSGAEWMVTGDPLTPKTVQITRQTRIGSLVTRHVPPVTVDGATLFLARSGREIREFIYTDVEQAYQATDLALVSRHLIKNPVDQDYDPLRRLLFIVREDGKFLTLTAYRAEAVAAWTLHETDGFVRSVAVAGGAVWMLVERGGGFSIEQLDDMLNLDAALSGENPAGAIVWSGLDHLENKEVMVLADGIVVGRKTVTDGAVTLDAPAQSVQIGLEFTHIVEPLPPVAAASARRVRLVEARFRVENTAALRVDFGRGSRDIPLRALNSGAPLLDAPAPLVSRDISVRALGWAAQSSAPLWRIEQDLPLPFTLLAVSMEIKTGG
ncbi:MAG: hypothetical protein H6862_02985 [Rhodospirillales bacterium]|nr:hypothetical protein [Rhodospirillales bacterium]